MFDILNSFNGRLELFKALLSLVVAVAVLAAGWFIGNRLSLQSSLRQKKRELELSSLNRLYELYGEFFAIWKLWDQKWKETAAGVDNFIPADHQWTLLQRACVVEGQVQAFLLKLAAERTLGEEKLDLLGRFRQAFQVLRERIRKGERLAWRSSVPSEYPEYASFKAHTYEVACFLFDSPAILERGSKPDSLALLKLTSNHWEQNWLNSSQVSDLNQRYLLWRRKAERSNPVA